MYSATLDDAVIPVGVGAFFTVSVVGVLAFVFPKNCQNKEESTRYFLHQDLMCLYFVIVYNC